MKKLVLLFTVLLMGLTTVTATEQITKTVNKDLDITSRYLYTEPILFVERGVEFLIFPDGSFDFKTDIFYAPTRNVYYRNRRNNRNRTSAAPGQVNNRSNRGVIVRHDRLGRVRRVGNVFINYDRFGRILRAGTVYMNYRRGLLRQVGGLRILYNRHGFVSGIRGQVNFSNPSHGIYGYTDYDSNQFFNNNSRSHRDSIRSENWDDNGYYYYYYKKEGKIKKQKN